MNYFLSLVISLLVLTNVSRAQIPGDSSLPPAPQQDTVVKKKKPPVHRPAADSTIKLRDTTISKKDTTRMPAADTAVVRRDSMRPVAVVQPFIQLPRGRLHYRGVLKLNPYFNFFASPILREVEERHPQGKETLFYLLTGLLLCLALIRVLFSKYMNNLLALVFRASLKQKQIREQLQQTPLPSLLLNIFFVVVAGLYAVFLSRHYGFISEDEFWMPFLESSMIIAGVYIIKFGVLKFTGWVFNMREATNTYIFIVFLVNKLLGIFLFPLIILMAFTMSSWFTALLTLSYVLVFSFFIYRYIVSFSPVRREVKVSPFHFFMYLCAFEIAPLILIYKVLLGQR
ncbi:MAG TPA: DUF4271 domain-containing protein [Chitinophagaceae bacterium]